MESALYRDNKKWQILSAVVNRRGVLIFGRLQAQDKKLQRCFVFQLTSMYLNLLVNLYVYCSWFAS